MLNLYEIQFEHFAPKDSEKGIYTYLAARNDEAVYEWLKSDPELKNGKHIFTGYEQYEEDEEEYEILDEDYNVIGTETFKERIIRLKGDINDEEKELDDLYYGATIMGWKLVKEGIDQKTLQIIKDSGVAIEKAY